MRQAASMRKRAERAEARVKELEEALRSALDIADTLLSEVEVETDTTRPQTLGRLVAARAVLGGGKP